MARLFVSYARKDARELADRVAAGVSPHEVWLDRQEIWAGQTWWREIAQNIDGSDIFLAILTVGYNESEVCGMELTQAFEEKKRRIPLLVHPKAEMPFLLRGVQWIPFTDATAIDDSIRKLLEAIEHPTPPEPPTPASLEWNDTVARGSKQARRFVRQHEGTFNEKLYVRRDEAEVQLAKFLEEDAPSLVVVGDSGIGKTNLLCHWTLDVLEQGHAVLAYDCSVLPNTGIRKEIAEDLRVPADDLTDALERIDAAAADSKRKLIIVFESAGDYRDGPESLLLDINSLAGRLGDNTRIVLSCNAAAWNRVQRTRPIRFDRMRSVQLGLFTEPELTRAYERYREVFELRSDLDSLAPSVRERLREPVLLRLTAEAFSKSPDPLPVANLAARVYERFFREHVQDAQSTLVDQLSEEMLRRRTSTLSMFDLGRDDQLGPQLLSDDPKSPYLRLLDCGVLVELRTDARAGTLIKFAHTRLAAYALARYLWNKANKSKDEVKSAVESLLVQDAEFPLAWEVAKTLLLLSDDRGAIVEELATSNDSEQRELAAEVLVDLHAESSEEARKLLTSLFVQEKDKGRRTALKAAYNIGPGTEDFFLHAAMEGAPEMREAVANTLYLIWRRPTTEAIYLIWKQAPEFTHRILGQLLDELNPRQFRKAFDIGSFVVDLTVMIYINHCDDERVIAKTAEVLHKLWIDCFHLDNRVLSWFAAQLPAMLSPVFGEQILKWMLMEMPPKEFFQLPQDERDRLARIGELFDPETDITAARDDLLVLLRRPGVPVFCGSAAMAIAIHAAHNFAATRPLIEELWKELAGRSRLWLLAGFAVLTKQTPHDWVELLETLTDSYVTENRGDFLGKESRLPGDVDIVFVPLGLAYGKRGDASMPLFEKWLQDDALEARCIEALGVAGFYYPEAMFETIRGVAKETSARAALVKSLATVRTLHYDAVDRFLGSIEASDALRHDVDVAADVELVRRYIKVLGYYNNAVHLSLRYPRMRKTLSTGALKLLATVSGPSQFVSRYTGAAMRMLRESKYDVMRWTDPE